jgi:uncharacterized protein (DUF302 family)
MLLPMNRRRCSFVLLASCKGFYAMANAAISAPVEYTSSAGFVATMNRLEEVIEEAGMKIFARIDHAAGARKVGLAMPPTVVLLYGNPRGGTPIMLAAPRAALHLPLRVLLREDSDGRTILSFHAIEPLLLDAGVPGELAARLAPAQQVLLKAIGR